MNNDSLLIPELANGPLATKKSETRKRNTSLYIFHHAEYPISHELEARIYWSKFVTLTKSYLVFVENSLIYFVATLSKSVEVLKSSCNWFDIVRFQSWKQQLTCQGLPIEMSHNNILTVSPSNWPVRLMHAQDMKWKLSLPRDNMKPNMPAVIIFGQSHPSN